MASRSPSAHLHLDSLQSLRGIAAIIVLLRHCTLTYPLSGGITAFLCSVLLNSHAAVVTFFVLSGFVLSLSLNGRMLNINALSGFYIKRICRVLPLLIFVTIVSFGYTLSWYSTLTVKDATPFFDVLMPYGPQRPAVVILSLLGLNSHYVPQNWTIMVELLVAPIFPFLFFAARASWQIFALMFAFLAIGSFLAPLGGHFLPLVYAVDFLVGVLVFLYWSRNAGKTYRHTTLITAIAAVVMVAAQPVLSLAHVPLVNAANFHDPMLSLIEAVSAGFVIFGLAQPGRLKGWFSGRMLVRLGDLSFSLYLVHFLVLVVAARLLDRLVPGFDALNSYAQTGILAAVVLGVSIAIAMPLYHFLEMPYNRMGRRLAFFDVSTNAKPIAAPASKVTTHINA